VCSSDLTVEDDEAFEVTRRLATQEGLFVGMSSGAAVAGALRIAATMTSGTIVVILPDRGDRYLSTELFKPICAKCPP
jgi:cysteine synthase B